jgi:hypothetical protein
LDLKNAHDEKNIATSGEIPFKKKWLMPDAEEPAAEMVLGVQLAGLADAADHFHGRDAG